MDTVMRLIPPDPRDGRIAELEAQIVAQARRIEALEAKLDLAAARHQKLEQVIADLRARLGENSRNSSKPPSSDRGKAPAELAQGRFGPRRAATVAVLTGMDRPSKRNALRLLEYVMGLEMALGTSSKLERHTSRALMGPVAEVAAAIHASPVVHIDETSWTEEKRTAWLWSTPTMPSAPSVRASPTLQQTPEIKPCSKRLTT